MRKIYSICLKVIIVFLLVFSSMQGIANAFWDSTPPIVSIVQVDKNTVHPGETVTLTINAIDNESIIKDVEVWYSDGKGYLETFEASYNQQTKQVEFKIPITAFSSLGNWKIKKIWFHYENGTFNTVDPSTEDLSSGTFEVSVKQDVESPIFKGITIDKKEVTLGNSVKVSISAEDVESETEVVNVSYLTPMGEVHTQAASYNWFKDRYEAIVPVLDFSNIGDWRVASVYLKDTKGNEVTIYNSSLYSSGVTNDLNSGNFQAIEDHGDALDSFDNSRFYSTNITLSNETIDGDVYIGPDSVLTINGNVTINGDLHILGSYVLSGNLQVKGTLNLTKKLDYVPIYLDNQPLTAVNDNVNISGKTIPFVSMYIEGQFVPINSDGTFVLNNLNVQDRQGVTIKFVDSSGHEVVRQFLVNHETKSAPPAPIVNAVSDQDTVVTGSAEASSKVEVKVNDEVIGTGTVGEDGQFTVTIPVQKADTELVITATDKAGNVSEATTVIVKDVAAPIKPTVKSVSDQATVVTGTAEANSTVYIKKGSMTLGYAKANSKGAYSVKIAKQQAGTNLSVYAKDAAKNKSATVTIKVVDKTAPVEPIVNSVSDQATVVTGTAEANSTVYVKKGSMTLGYAKANSKGAYSVKIAKQQAGTILSVYVEDAAKNKSKTVTLTVADKTAPSKPIVNSVSDQATVVTGTAEANSTVYVKKGSMTLGYAKTNSKGVYSIKVAKQKAGTILSVYVEDAAKNKGETVTLTVVDKTVPSKPIVNSVSDQATVVTGTAEAGATVYVYKGKTLLGQNAADKKGNYKVNIVKQKKGTKLTIYVKDKAGNQSATQTIQVN